MQHYYTEDKKGNAIRTEYPVASVREARQWFIGCRIFMAIDPQPASEYCLPFPGDDPDPACFRNRYDNHFAG